MMPGILYQKGAIRKNSSPTLFINHVEFTNKALFYNLSDTDECFLFKTVSGIMFCKDTPFFDCFLCQDNECQGRKAGYNSQVAEFYQNL